MTVDYLKQRKQFGKLIGEFQALQHRAAHLYAEIEIARAATLKAQQLLDEGRRQSRADGLGRQGQGRPTSSALAVQEGVQMHGGIGMTDEHDIGLYMKRDAVLGELFGDIYPSPRTGVAARARAADSRSTRQPPELLRNPPMMPRMNEVTRASWIFPSGSLQPKYRPPQPTSAMNMAIAIPATMRTPPWPVKY